MYYNPYMSQDTFTKYDHDFRAFVTQLITGECLVNVTEMNNKDKNHVLRL